MARYRLQVVLSQAQGKHPAKRALEEAIVAALLLEPGVEVAVIPHLYDLDVKHPGRMSLEAIRGDMVLLSWLYSRAAFWLLDRDGVRGMEGQTCIKPAQDSDDDDDVEVEPPKGIGSLSPPDRYIYCLDLRDSDKHEVFVEEIRRIAAECRARAEAKTEAKAAQPMLVELGSKLDSNGHVASNGNVAASS